MTIGEAKKIARLIGFADSGCDNCVTDLVDHANRLFPNLKFTKHSQDWQRDQEVYHNQWGLEIIEHFVPVTVESRP